MDDSCHIRYFNKLWLENIREIAIRGDLCILHSMGFSEKDIYIFKNITDQDIKEIIQVSNSLLFMINRQMLDAIFIKKQFESGENIFSLLSDVTLH